MADAGFQCLAVQIKDAEEKVHRKQERAIMLHLLRNSAPVPLILAGSRGIIQLNYKMSFICRNARKFFYLKSALSNAA